MLRSSKRTRVKRQDVKIENKLVRVAKRGKSLLKEEGLLSLLKKGMAFLRLSLFEYGTFYVYEYTIKERNEADFLPKIRDYRVHIVCNNQQADDLEAQGLIFRSSSIYARTNLDKGAIAVCIFVGQELAHMNWIALTEEAKKDIDYIPFQIDFAKKEACTGSSVTIPKYTGLGLMVYGIFRRLEVLREKGIKISRNSVATNNIASQRALAKFGPKIKSTGRYLKILWWQSWKETPWVPGEYN